MKYLGLFDILLFGVIAASNANMSALKPELIASLIEFCGDYYTEAVKSAPSSTSLVLSPTSANLYFSILSLATSGPIHDEILKALKLPDDEYIRTQYGLWANLYASQGGYKGVTFNFANKVYVKSGPYKLSKQFIADLNLLFIPTEIIDLSDTTAAAKTINEWTAQATNNSLKNVISPDRLKDASVVIINGYHFEGKFDNVFTTRRPFHASSSSVIGLPFMSFTGHFRYEDNAELGAVFLELPFPGNDAALIVALPKTATGLNAMESHPSFGALLRSTTSRMVVEHVNVKLPCLEFTYETDNSIIMPKLHISKIFHPNGGGFSNIVNPPANLYVSDAHQIASIKVVGEKNPLTSESNEGSKTFLANHPFSFTVATKLGPIYFGRFFG